MRFTVTRQNLHNALVAVSSAVPSKTTLPVLSNILFDTDADGVWMSGTDLDVAVRVHVPADVQEGGSLTAPGKKLQEITRELPDQPVEVATRGDQIELRCGKSHFKLNGLPSEEFPALPAVEFEGGWSARGADLHTLIQHTAFAVSSEESRPILNGVLWELRDGMMRMVATNGHRLARMSVPAAASAATSADLIVPPNALQQVPRLCKSEDEIRVSRSGNHLGFKSGGTEVYTRLIDGTYPNYDQVIPKDNDKFLTVDSETLAQAVKRVAVLSNSLTHQVKFSVSQGAIELSATNQDVGGEARETVPCQYDKDDLEIGYNAVYILDILKSVGPGDVVFELATSVSAGLIHAADDQRKKEHLCLVMPLRLAD